MARFGMSERTLSRFPTVSHDLTGYAVCKCDSCCPSYIIGHDVSAGWHILTRRRLSDMVVIMVSIFIAYKWLSSTNKLSRSKDKVKLSEW